MSIDAKHGRPLKLGQKFMVKLCTLQSVALQHSVTVATGVTLLRLKSHGRVYSMTKHTYCGLAVVDSRLHGEIYLVQTEWVVGKVV